MHWRAWYTEGRVFNGRTLDHWKVLPEDGVLGVVAFKETGKTVYDGGDWYMFDGTRFAFVPSGPVWGVDAPRPVGWCRQCVKRYGKVSEEEYRQVAREIQAAHP